MAPGEWNWKFPIHGRHRPRRRGKCGVRDENRSGGQDLIHVEQIDTGRSYGMKAIDICTDCDLAAPGSDIDIDVDIDVNMTSIASALRSNTLSTHRSSLFQGVRGGAESPFTGPSVDTF